jgi:Holliday junction resolvase RusA-like endonuclease
MAGKLKKAPSLPSFDFLAPSTYTSVSRRDWDNMQKNALDPKRLKIGKKSRPF